MSYWLNGKRLYLKGAWYPISDYYLSKPTRETYEKDLEMYKAANLNHLVGFTVVEKPDFYDLCDRLGILDILEFPFDSLDRLRFWLFQSPARAVCERVPEPASANRHRASQPPFHYRLGCVRRGT